MTYIYVDVTQPGEAVVVSDTWAYDLDKVTAAGITDPHVADKVRTFPALGLAAFGVGGSTLITEWMMGIEMLSVRGLDAEQIAAAAPRILSKMWRDAQADARHLGGLQIGHVAWDDQTGRYTLTVFASWRGFKPTRLDGVFVHPTPVGYRFNELELEETTDGLRETMAHPGWSERDRANHEHNLREVRDGAREIPAQLTVDNHVGFAEFVRDSRSRIANSTSLRVLIGGELYMTFMTPTVTATQRLHVFDDDITPPELVAASESRQGAA